MLGKSQYYNRSIRKVVVAFGTIFNDIQIQRTSKDGATNFEIFKVPLTYGSKERWLTAIESDPTLTKSIAVSVPRISFELTGMSYDNSRKQQSLLKNFSKTASGHLESQYVPVPYDFNFSMSIFVRNTEDGTQIVEQILPFFKPDFTVTVNMIPSMDQKYDMPIILNSVNTTTDYEGGLSDGTTRLIVWDLEFTVKSYLWPNVTGNTSIIGAFSATTGRYGTANTNIFIDNQKRDAQKVYVNYSTGNNYYTTGETIRIDRNGTNEITGKVIYFSNTSSGVLIVGELTDLLKVNDVVVGDFTKASYTVTEIDMSPVKAVSIVTRAVPRNAQYDDDFGFLSEIAEWPEQYVEDRYVPFGDSTLFGSDTIIYTADRE